MKFRKSQLVGWTFMAVIVFGSMQLMSIKQHHAEAQRNCKFNAITLYEGTEQLTRHDKTNWEVATEMCSTTQGRNDIAKGYAKFENELLARFETDNTAYLSTHFHRDETRASFVEWFLSDRPERGYDVRLLNRESLTAVSRHSLLESRRDQWREETQQRVSEHSERLGVSS
jgi:hypothetical protein